MRKIAKKTVIVFIALLVIAGMGFIVMFAYNNRPVDVTEKNIEKVMAEEKEEYYQVNYDDPEIPESLREDLKNDPVYGLPSQDGFIEEINDSEVILAFGSVQKWDPSALRQTFKFTDDTMYLDVKQGQVIKSYDDINTLSPKDFKVDDCVLITFNKLPSGDLWVVAIANENESDYLGGICGPLFPDSKEVTKKNLGNLLETILRSIGINR
ncbi:hypothetical protein [Candidatus Oleimmundimicrobium sp.]|uniref:hypothetical protein n=1 Tax=Candidatus Oleimmundimicrobium sp. TaxID=3060597 RepID=UPI0027284054|nr:hypothetical protein [Candidatus Oleimmundimicrobium sp.]MDO8886669.1 hypothetical protein [Candidatus Oleimmundimicrobium sp.]